MDYPVFEEQALRRIGVPREFLDQPGVRERLRAVYDRVRADSTEFGEVVFDGYLDVIGAAAGIRVRTAGGVEVRLDDRVRTGHSIVGATFAAIESVVNERGEGVWTPERG